MDYEAIQDIRDRYRKRFEELLAHAMSAPQESEYAARLGPFSLGFMVYDGPGVMIFDGDNRPILQEPLRDPEDAVVLLNTLNSAMLERHAQRS